MKVIVPCCGRSSRYPDLPPKWMLPGHDGRPMLTLAVAGLDVVPSDLVVVILAEHDETYRASAGINDAFGEAIEIIVLDDPTQSQSETVARAIEHLDLDEPFLVKDSDNFFELHDVEQRDNYVSVDSLNNHELINPRNKSYLQVDHNDVITNIREKEVISDLFSVGGYYFSDPAQFMGHYRHLSAKAPEWSRELYLSDVIGAMILDGVPFRARPVQRYEDWGTVHEWRRTRLNQRAFFVSLDGFLFDRGSEFFQPRFDEVVPNPAAVDAVRVAVDHGHTVRLLSIRPERFREITERQLANVGLAGIDVVYGCPLTSWTLVTAPHPTLPFRTGNVIELLGDDPNLSDKILDPG